MDQRCRCRSRHGLHLAAFPRGSLEVMNTLNLQQVPRVDWRRSQGRTEDRPRRLHCPWKFPRIMQSSRPCLCLHLEDRQVQARNNGFWMNIQWHSPHRRQNGHLYKRWGQRNDQNSDQFRRLYEQRVHLYSSHALWKHCCYWRSRKRYLKGGYPHHWRSTQLNLQAHEVYSCSRCWDSCVS